MSNENETQTGAPRTAAALIQEAARVVNWRPDEKHPMQARYDAARAMASMYAYWTIVSLETLRRVDPALAEDVTTHIDNDLDWANAHEHAYGWEQTLAAGKPIPADAWPFWEITGQPDAQPAGEHHTGTLNLAGEGNAPQDTLAALDDEICRTYGAIHAPDNLAEILAKHGWVKADHAAMPDRDARLIQRALEALPAECRYHGENFEQDYGMHGTGSCCDTGKPSLYRHHAEAALKRARGDE